MPDFADIHQPVHAGVAERIQTVMAQQAVQIGPGGFGIRLLTGLFEEFLTAPGVVAVAQLTHGGIHDGIVIEQNVRPMQTDVVHPAEAADALAGRAGQRGQGQLAEAVVGVIGGHCHHLVLTVFPIVHQFPEKGKKKS